MRLLPFTAKADDKLTLSAFYFRMRLLGVLIIDRDMRYFMLIASIISDYTHLYPRGCLYPCTS